MHALGSIPSMSYIDFIGFPCDLHFLHWACSHLYICHSLSPFLIIYFLLIKKKQGERLTLLYPGPTFQDGLY